MFCEKVVCLSGSYICPTIAVSKYFYLESGEGSIGMRVQLHHFISMMAEVLSCGVASSTKKLHGGYFTNQLVEFTDSFSFSEEEETTSKLKRWNVAWYGQHVRNACKILRSNSSGLFYLERHVLYMIDQPDFPVKYLY